MECTFADEIEGICVVHMAVENMVAVGFSSMCL